MLRGRIGIALGSGGARGFAHVGVLRGLLEAGIEPEIVCGVSAGAVVGAAYACDRLDAFERWSRELDRRQVMGLLDVSFRGGAVRGRRMIEQIGSLLPEGARIDALQRPYGAVATDLESGREIWLRDVSLLDAIHASCAVPGVVSPVRIDGRWLVDGGLVNPVPVTPCRALGADTVIAVDLNTSLLARRFRGEAERPPAPPRDPSPHAGESSPGAFQQIWSELRQRFVGSEPAPPGAPSPGLYDVLNNALEIMQVRITRSRLAGDPPDLLVTPRLPDFALLDLHRADDAIAEGRRAVTRALSALRAGDPDSS